MKKRSVFSSIIQVIFAIVGIGLIGITAYLFAGNVSLLNADEAGEVIGLLIILPVQLIVSFVASGFGIITTIISSVSRHREETKTKFSLAMLIISLCTLLLPLLLDGAIFVIARIIGSAA
ncbi:MAG: hypothetical protein MJZ37_05995 [Bacilli bacterium]|nr:hypothetical protein [Bacilli bacterium]